MIGGLPFAGGSSGRPALALIAIVVVSFLRAPPVRSPQSKRGRAPAAGDRLRSRASSAAASRPGLLRADELRDDGRAARHDRLRPAGRNAALAIQWHVLAMYGPSFFTGRLIVRFGKERVTAAGLVPDRRAAIVGLVGPHRRRISGSRWSLLGVGWNFGFIGATALVTETATVPKSAPRFRRRTTSWSSAPWRSHPSRSGDPAQFERLGHGQLAGFPARRHRPRAADVASGRGRGRRESPRRRLLERFRAQRPVRFLLQVALRRAFIFGSASSNLAGGESGS